MEPDRHTAEYPKQVELHIHWGVVLTWLYTGTCLLLLVLARFGLVNSLATTPSAAVGVQAILIALALVLPGPVLAIYLFRQRCAISLGVLLIGVFTGAFLAFLFLERYVIQNPRFP